MRILLTGTTGQVGGALHRPLSAMGRVLAVGRDELDLQHPETIASTLDRLRPDLIVNPAAYTAVDLAEDERDIAFRVNGDTPGVMAIWAAAHDVPFVHFSTDYVFDGSGDTAWKEDSEPRPLSVYGESKLAGEQAVREAGGRHVIIRTSWVYASAGRNFLTTMARLASQRAELRVVADQHGAPTSARSIADAVTRILQGEDAADGFRENSGLVNLTASGVASWHDFATAIVAGMKARGALLACERVLPIATADYPTRAVRPLNSRLDPSRLQRSFGIEMPSWQDALEVELDTAFWKEPELRASR
jgi:dTDP-4-dehydrorhamnose reductase